MFTFFVRFPKFRILLKTRNKIGWYAGENQSGSANLLDCKMFKHSMTNIHEVAPVDVKAFLDSFDTVLSDCDGVLWIENGEVSGSAKVLNSFRKLGKKVFFVTNNSTMTRGEFANKAQKLGFTASKDDILSTSFLVAHYLDRINFKKKVYLIGSTGITQELDAVGIKHTGVGPDPVKPNFKSMQPSDLDPEVGAVVVGFDEHFCYPKMMKAATYLNNHDCLFVATNTDERFPRSGGTVIPGTGSLVRAVETCAERQALVVGKPHKYIRDYLVASGLDPARTLMIGDRCNTDIELGLRCGFQTLLVLTGVTSERDLNTMRVTRAPPLPDVVLPSLAHLQPFLPS